MESTTENPTPTPAPSSSSAPAAPVAAPSAKSALEKASGAASSAATPPTGTNVGDTTQATGTGTPETKPPASSAAPVADPNQRPAGDGTPEHRITAAVRNARTKVYQEYGLLGEDSRPLSADHVKTGLEMFNSFRQDPWGFIQRATAYLNRQTGRPQPQDGDGEDTLPEPDIVSKDGAKAWSVAAQQRALDIHGRQVRAAILEELRPFLQFTEGQQQRVTEEQQRAENRRRGQAAIETARSWKHFKENEQAILASIREMDPDQLRQLREDHGHLGVLSAVYHTYLDAHVYPQADSDAERRVREDLTRRANAGGNLHPSSAGGPAAKPKLETVQDLSAHLKRLSEAQARR